jgi:hypothetical protein
MASFLPSSSCSCSCSCSFSCSSSSSTGPVNTSGATRWPRACSAARDTLSRDVPRRAALGLLVRADQTMPHGSPHRPTQVLIITCQNNHPPSICNPLPMRTLLHSRIRANKKTVTHQRTLGEEGQSPWSQHQRALCTGAIGGGEMMPWR